MTTPKYKLVKPSRSKFWLIRLAHPCAEGWRERSTKQVRRRDAERIAAQIVSGLLASQSQRMTWAAFRKRYESDHLPLLKRPGCFRAAAAKFEAIHPAHYLDALDAAHMKQWRQKMLAAGMKSTTVASYLKHIRASLGWAEENGYIKVAPRVRSGTTAKMKGRALTGEEFERILKAVSKVVGREDAAQWKRLLYGLWLMGLRLQESLSMSWDDSNAIRPVRLDTSRPLVCYPGDEQKNKKDQLVPLTPEAIEFLRATPAKNRVGLVFPLMGKRKPILSADRASRKISDMGEIARVITGVDSTTGEKIHATAHDLRRSFALRLAPKLSSDQLKVMMRHADIKTTNTHYAELEADQLADQISKALQ